MKLGQLIRFKGENFHSKKVKVTLTLDETLVKLAKSAEINLSATLENILHAFIDGGEVLRQQPVDAHSRAIKGWKTRRANKILIEQMKDEVTLPEHIEFPQQ